MSDQTSTYLAAVKAQDVRALARFLTWLDAEGPAALKQVPELLRQPQLAFRVGITGPPGAGKSTLVGKLIKELRQQDLRVAVLAIDPSSPFSKGAILGDRIRYTEHFTDPKVFIRSLGTRGSLGGLSASAYLMVRAFDLAGFDVVLLETVGVGQTELEVVHVADLVSVVLVPESGDSIQAMKAGLTEIADVFVVNKADRPGAEAFRAELETSLHLGGDEAKIFLTSATDGKGVDQYFSHLLNERLGGEWKSRRNDVDRLKGEARALLRQQLEREAEVRLGQLKSGEDLAKLF